MPITRYFKCRTHRAALFSLILLLVTDYIVSAFANSLHNESNSFLTEISISDNVSACFNLLGAELSAPFPRDWLEGQYLQIFFF